MSADPLSRTRPLILIVDDVDDAREIYQQYLTFKGYRVMTVRNGAEAIEAALTHHPAVIFMDLRMPVMSGTQAMLALRRDPGFVPVPIVAFTAHALAAEQTQALQEGFDEVITKPCLPDELSGAIDRLLAR